MHIPFYICIKAVFDWRVERQKKDDGNERQKTIFSVDFSVGLMYVVLSFLKRKKKLKKNGKKKSVLDLIRQFLRKCQGGGIKIQKQKEKEKGKYMGIEYEYTLKCAVVVAVAVLSFLA